MKIKADELAATVEKTLSDYVEDVNDVVKQEIKDAGANFFIAGSAVFKPRERMAENVKAFNAILHA